MKFGPQHYWCHWSTGSFKFNQFFLGMDRTSESEIFDRGTFRRKIVSGYIGIPILSVHPRDATCYQSFGLIQQSIRGGFIRCLINLPFNFLKEGNIWYPTFFVCLKIFLSDSSCLMRANGNCWLIMKRMKEKFVSVFSHCSLLYSPSMGDSSILLTGGTKQHCHSCNICRNKELICLPKVDKIRQKWA